MSTTSTTTTTASSIRVSQPNFPKHKCWYLPKEEELSKVSNLRERHQSTQNVSWTYLNKLGIKYFHMEVERHEEFNTLTMVRKHLNIRSKQYSVETFDEGHKDFNQGFEFYNQLHVHKGAEVRYVIEGEAYYDISDAIMDQQLIRIHLCKGDLLLIPKGLPHRMLLPQSPYSSSSSSSSSSLSPSSISSPSSVSVSLSPSAKENEKQQQQQQQQQQHKMRVRFKQFSNRGKNEDILAPYVCDSSKKSEEGDNIHKSYLVHHIVMSEKLNHQRKVDLAKHKDLSSPTQTSEQHEPTIPIYDDEDDDEDEETDSKIAHNIKKEYHSFNGKGYVLGGRAGALANYPHMRECQGLVYVSGTSSRRPDNTHIGATKNEKGIWEFDIRLQTQAVLENIKVMLSQAEVGLEHLLQVTVFLVDFQDYQGMNEVYNQYFDAFSGPTRTTVAVAQLPHPNLLIEIQAVAVKQ